jgi:NADPH2:quinone reductase
VKAAVYYQAGGPEVFRYEDVPDPEPAPDGVLVRVEAISIEGGDTLHRASGAYIESRQAFGRVLLKP